MHLITVHISTNFYPNVIIISEVIYCSMCKNVILKETPINIFFSKNVILRKIPINIFLAIFYYTNLKSDT